MKNFKTDIEHQIINNKPITVRVPSNYFIVAACTAPEYRGGDIIINGNNITTKDQNGVKQVFSDAIGLHLMKSWGLSNNENMLRLHLRIHSQKIVDSIQYDGVEIPIDYMECVFDCTGCEKKNYITYKICEKELKLP